MDRKIKKNSRTSVTDEEAGRPSTATNDDIERVRDVVVRRMTIDELANRLQTSHGSAYEIIF
jgi:hypothetical protein